MPIGKDYNYVQDRLKAALPQIKRIHTDKPTMLYQNWGEIRVEIEWQSGRVTDGTCHFRLGLEGKSAQATSPIEDAQSSAMGRALAAGGFYAQGQYASQDEIERAIVFQEATQPPVEETPDPNVPNDGAVQQQDRYDEAIAVLREHKAVVNQLYPTLTPKAVREMPLDTLENLVRNVLENVQSLDIDEPATKEETSVGGEQSPPPQASQPRTGIEQAFQQRELASHDGRAWASMTDSEALELMAELIASPLRSYQAECKYCKVPIYWGHSSQTDKRMPFNADGTYHHATCTALDIDKQIEPMPVVPAKAPDQLPMLGTQPYPAYLMEHIGKTDNIPLSLLAQALYVNREEEDEICSIGTQKLLATRLNAVTGGPNYAIAWALVLMGRIEANNVGIQGPSFVADRLLWWINSYEPRTIRNVLDTLAPHLCTQFTELAPWLCNMPQVSLLKPWNNRPVMLFAQGLLEEDQHKNVYGVKTTADVYLLIKKAWGYLKCKEYYNTLVQDVGAINNTIGSDERMYELLDQAIDAGMEVGVKA